jgi:hypothetical protein
MDERIANEKPDDLDVYEAPKVLASFDADEVLAEAETGSSIGG